MFIAKEKLREVMKEQDLSQVKICKILGMERNSWSNMFKYFSGKLSFGEGLRQKISDIVGYDESELFEEIETDTERRKAEKARVNALMKKRRAEAREAKRVSEIQD